MRPEAQRGAGDSAQAIANARVADAVVDALLRHGVQRAFVAPGSRSTPLIFALARRGVVTEVLLDERVAGYCAIGAARLGVTAAVITTSGTAVANLLPACCEADRDDLPWVACTADRPARDVERGANQTLQQMPLLAGPCRRVIDLDDAVGSEEPTTPLSQRLDHALAALTGRRRGPVHINVRFDKPLEPPRTWHTSASPSAPFVQQSEARESLEAAQRLLDEPAGVVVLGNLPRGSRPAVRAFVSRLGWPVIADVTAGPLPPDVVRLPSVALRVPALASALQAKAALWIGGNATDDAVSNWLRGQQTRVVQLLFSATRRDPFELAMATIYVDPEGRALLEQLIPLAIPNALLPLVRRSSRVGVDALAKLRARHAGLSEPQVLRDVLCSIRAQELLFIGNSMPVRDANAFAADALDVEVEVLTNRGVSGIDGGLATILGAAWTSGRPATAVLGDLAFLHDLSGLAAAIRAGVALRIVVINNGGGGIFSFLPVVAQEPQLVERFFDTPHAFRLADLAVALGARARRVETRDALVALLGAAPREPEVIEVCTRRQDNVALHAALIEEVAAACAAALESAA